MNLSKYLLQPTIVLALCAILMFTCGLEGGNFLLSWVIFHCWAIYFFSGCTIPNGLRAILNYMIGAFACVAIIFLIGKLAPSCGPAHATTISCSLVAFCLMFLANVPFANNIPATFCGASAFFALGQFNKDCICGHDFLAAFSGDCACQTQIIIRLFIGILYGCVLGWATVALQTSLTKLLAPKQA